MIYDSYDHDYDDDDYDDDYDDDWYVENPFQAKFGGCPGCGEALAGDEMAEYYNRYYDCDDDDPKEKWVVHDTQKCVEAAHNRPEGFDPVCSKHGSMGLKFGKFGAYWQCGAKTGKTYCNEKPPKGKGTWKPLKKKSKVQAASPKPKLKGGVSSFLSTKKYILFLDSAFQKPYLCVINNKVIQAGTNSMASALKFRKAYMEARGGEIYIAENV
jgi:hypothetical protein